MLIPQPERDLWATVIFQAVEDLAEACALRHNALAWILSSDSRVGSFKWCCGQLELDSSAAQARILRADQRRIATESKPSALPAAPVTQVTIIPPDPKKEWRPKMKNGNGKHNGIGHHLEWLKDQLSQYENRLVAAEAQVTRFKFVTINLRGCIEALSPELQQPMAATSLQPHNAAKGKLPVGTKREFKPKRNVLPALARRPPYNKVPIGQALADILKASNEPIHHDELTRAVFNVDDGQDFERAKSSCTARLSKGKKRGAWRALGGGRWQIEKQGMSA